MYWGHILVYCSYESMKKVTLMTGFFIFERRYMYIWRDFLSCIILLSMFRTLKYVILDIFDTFDMTISLVGLLDILADKVCVKNKNQ